MKLKNRVSFLVSIEFTVLYALAATTVYILFADFRKEEFESRLNEKAITSIKLLVEVAEVDERILKIIDANSIRNLYNESFLIFDDTFKLIYESNDNKHLDWSRSDLEFLKKNRRLYRKQNELDVFGLFYQSKNKGYYALVSANDKYGQRKLEYLLYLLVITYIIFTAIGWLSTTLLIRKSLVSIDLLLNKIKSVKGDKDGSSIALKTQSEEIQLLVTEFNLLLDRISKSHEKQKEFTANASHELRTPISRIIAQIENRLDVVEKVSFDDHKELLNEILKDLNSLSELISSLLVLSQVDIESEPELERVRLDELVFDSAQFIHEHFGDARFQIHFDDDVLVEHKLEIIGNRSQLQIVFNNLLKNAYLYSDSKIIDIRLIIGSGNVVFVVENDGMTLTQTEQKYLFEPFMRGANSKNKKGLGLGLRIVARILQVHRATIAYLISIEGKNRIEVTFLNH